MPRANGAWLLGVGLLLVACTLEPLDLEGRRCPCVSGWVCDSSGTCVRRLDASGDDAAVADAGSDAGMPDAGLDGGGANLDAGDASGDASADAAPDPTACDDILAGALFCDGFEDSTLTAWDSVDTTDGVVDTVTTPVHRGQGALRGRTSAPDGRAGVHHRFPPLSAPELWLRAYFYVPSDPPIESVSLFYLYEDAPPYDGLSLQVATGARTWIYVAPDVVEPGGIAPLDAWFCLQARVVLSDTEGRFETWLDGAPSTTVGPIDTLPATPHAGVVVGLERAGEMQTTATAYVDDFAMGTSMLPCD